MAKTPELSRTQPVELGEEQSEETSSEETEPKKGESELEKKSQGWLLTTPRELIQMETAKVIEETGTTKVAHLNPKFDPIPSNNWQELIDSNRWMIFVQWYPNNDNTLRCDVVVSVKKKKGSIVVSSGEEIGPNHQIAVKINRMQTERILFTKKE